MFSISSGFVTNSSTSTIVVLFPNVILDELKNIDFDTIYRKILEHPFYQLIKNDEYLCEFVFGGYDIKEIAKKIFEKCKNDIINELQKNDTCIVRVECDTDGEGWIGNPEPYLTYIVIDILFSIFYKKYKCQIDYEYCYRGTVEEVKNGNG